MVRTKWSKKKNDKRQIIEAAIDLSKSCLWKEEQEVYYLLVMYTEAIILGDEIGTYPNIEVDLQVIDKFSIFSLDHFMLKKVNQ